MDEEMAVLHASAERNLQVFDRVVDGYAHTKLAHVVRPLEEGTDREGWLDADGCAWCLFDDPGFERRGARPSELRSQMGAAFDLQIFWSIEDIVMPGPCDAHWVAGRICNAALHCLPKMGYRAKLQKRVVDGEVHQGVLVRRRGWLWPARPQGAR